MLSPRWQKVRRDLWTSRGRMSLLIVAVAASLFAIGTTLGAYSVLSRELTRAYRATRPASATIATDSVSAALVERVRALPDVAAAEARATILARVRVGGDWRPLLLFVVPDFDAMQLSTFTHLQGDWPPPTGSMLVDHMALQLVGARLGERVMVKTAHGNTQSLRLAGLVWDSGLAPAPMERTVWAYITPPTLTMLNGSGILDEVKIIEAKAPLDERAIEVTAHRVADFLRRQGHAVHEIQIPSPGRHPHQGQMEAIMLMLNGFSIVALLLSGVLVASMVSAMLARQVREIGVMKAVGAQRHQVATLYLAMMIVLGVGALAIAVPTSRFVAINLVSTTAASLNIRIASTAIPWWVLAVQLATGIVLPVGAAAFPVLRASRIAVREAIQDSGVSEEPFGSRGLDAWLGRLRRLDVFVKLGVRNAFRRPGRLLMTLGLLSAGGAMFLTGMNTAKGWSARLGEVNSGRHYDLDILFQRPEPVRELMGVVEAVPGVAIVEAWGFANASWGKTDSVEVVHTYPDKGHGAFRVMGVPAETKLVRFPLLSGRWLEPGDEGVVVLNHIAASAVPEAKVGSTVTISVEGIPHTWRVVGLVRDIGSPAIAYVSSTCYSAMTSTPGATRFLRVATLAKDPAERAETIRQAEQAIERAGMDIEFFLPVEELVTAVGEHMAILLGVIMLLAGLMTLVGVLGLAAAMSTGVLERMRELGVMQAIGATSSLVLRIILGEGLFVGALSGILAVALAVPLSIGVGTLVGNLAFRAPLPLVMNPEAVLAWVATALASSALATAIPALRASRMTVYKALVYV